MSVRELPWHPNLEHLKKQARSLLRDQLAADVPAAQRFAACGVSTEQPKLADAFHVIAREYGFEAWPPLKLHVQLLTADPVEALIAAIRANDAAAVPQVFTRYPSLKAHINEPLPNYGFDEPPVLAAVHKQNRDMVDALLDAGANVNERSRWWAGSFGVLDFASPDLASFAKIQRVVARFTSTASGSPGRRT